MKGSRAINRYAGALLSLSREMGKTEEVKSDMDTLLAIAKDSRDFRNFVHSPIVSAAQKLKTLQALFQGTITPLTLKFIELLVSRKRESLTIEIAGSFVRRYKDMKGISTAVVTTAETLDAETRTKVIATAMAMSEQSNEIELIEKVDPEIIGGFVFEMNNRKYNASILGELNRLRKEFDANPYIKEF